MKFYEKTWFIVLMALFIPPVALGLILFKKKTMNKIIKAILVAVLAFWSLLWVIAIFVPADSVETDVSASTTQAVGESTTERITTTVKATTEKEATTEESTIEETTEATTNTPPTTKKAETTQKVEEKTTEKQTSATTKKQQEETTKKVVSTTKNPDASVTVYRTKTGSSYHYENPCGNGTYYPITLEEAKNAGLSPCGKCVLH